MMKVKWIKINCQLSITEMAERLMTDSFTEDKGKGFIFDKYRPNYFHGRFIEKIITEDKISNLYGDLTPVERIEYRTTNFTVDKQFSPVVSIGNPPRTLKPFAQSLVKNLGLGISVEEIEVDPFSWYTHLCKRLTLRIILLEVSQIQVAEFALAKMQISSTNDLKKYFNDELSNKKLRLDRLTCSIHSAEYIGKIKLFRNGMAQIDARAGKNLSELLFESLMEIKP